MEIITKKEAKEQGLKFYFTGKSCKRGHFSVRTVYNGVCKDCLVLWNLANKETLKKYRENYYINNKDSVRISIKRCKDLKKVEYAETHKKSLKKWRQINQEYISEYNKKYYRNNIQREKARSKKYKEENPDRIKQQGLAYSLANKEKIRVYRREYNVRYRRMCKAQTPSWANLDKIKEIYANCPKGYHVDHIYPLQGKLVCGLHVENNLQYLTKEENLRKGNKFIPICEVEK